MKKPVCGTHNAGVEGSSPSLSTINNSELHKTLYQFCTA